MISIVLRNLQRIARQMPPPDDAYKQQCREDAIFRTDAVLNLLDDEYNPRPPIHREIHDVLILYGESGMFD